MEDDEKTKSQVKPEVSRRTKIISVAIIASILVVVAIVLAVTFTLAARHSHGQGDSQPSAVVQNTTSNGTGSPLPTIFHNTTVSLSPAPTVAINALLIVDPTFPTFSCEERSLLYYAGPSGRPNNFSRNLLHEIASRTGATPVLRVGGTSLDHSTYDPRQTIPVNIPPDQEQRNIPANMTFGPSYFDSFANLPVQYIVDIPLATQNLDNSVKFASAAYEKIGAANIEQFEIGNEPNYYPDTVRPASYSPEDYVAQWLNWSQAIISSLHLPAVEPLFQVVALASPLSSNTSGWTSQDMFSAGLGSDFNQIKSYSMHYYQTIATENSSLQNDLMNHAAIVAGTESFAQTVAYLNSLDRQIPLHVGEAGSALNLGPNDFALEAVLGSALWQVDFMLWCLSIGIGRVHIQLGIGFGFAPWQPVEYNGLPASVNAPYYAHLLVADFIGNATGLQVENVDLHSELMSAYAGYEDGQLSRLALVNLEEWSPGARAGARPSALFEVDVPAGTRTATVRRLASPGGAAERDSAQITWGGASWTFESDGLARQAAGVGTAADVVLDVPAGGRLSVAVEASAAVVVFLGS